MSAVVELLQSADPRFARDLQAAPNGCIEFTGYRRTSGHGQLHRGNRVVYTHRLAWEITNGPIPEGGCVCHHCDNPPCCNPAHLFLGTRVDNNLDRDAKGREAWGERMHTSRLTAEQVLRIRADARQGDALADIARRYGVARSTISDIRWGKTWKRLGGAA